MSNKIGFIGVGQAGSNVCEVAETLGYKTLVVNTSPEDLDSLQLVNNRLLVGRQGGSGKDRNIAKRELKEKYKEVAAFVAQRFQNSEIELIYVVFSTGGGTGSGMGPLLIDILKTLTPGKLYGAITILPSKDESAVAHANSYECLKELSSLSVPTIIVDNDKCKAKSKPVLYDTVNEAVIEDLDMLLNSKRSPSKYGNIDTKDIIKLLTTPGVTTIGLLTDINMSLPLSTQIIHSFNDSPYAPLEMDGVISRIGMIYEVNKDVVNMINNDEIFNVLGTPLELFEGIYTDAKNSNVISIILSGQSFPLERAKSLLDVVNSSKEKFATKSDFTLDTDALDWFHDKRSNSLAKKEHVKDIDISALFKKY